MFKPQMKFQKLMFLFLLIFSALFFFYAVGLLTDLYPLYLSQAYGTVVGAELFDEIQPYNKSLVTFSIVIILCSLLPFIFSSNKRRKYYLDNYITCGVQSLGYIACSIFTIFNTIKWKNKFLNTVDLEALKQQAEKRKWFYSGTTIWFDLGFVFAALFIIMTGLIIFNCLWKNKIMNEEKKILEGGVKDE